MHEVVHPFYVVLVRKLWGMVVRFLSDDVFAAGNL